MLSETIETAIYQGLQAAIPESALTVSRWAASYRFVSAERSANSGRWSNDLTPWLVDIMDAANDLRVSKIVFMKSSQVAGTEAICNIFGYFIHIDPTLLMYLAEDETKVEAFSKEAFMPMVRETTVLNSLIAEPKERTSTNTIKLKSFRGGNIVFAHASSPASLSSRPRRVIGADEVDAYKPTKEGDPLKLAEARTKTFLDQKLMILVSSPRNKETSTIEPEYENSDQRKFYVPCPGCEEFQVLKWANVRWDEEPELAYYICDLCGVIIEEDEKNDMVAAGEWRAEADFHGTAGFWINELYSPFSTWGEMAIDFVESKRFATEKNDINRLKVFVNTRLGETWETEGERIDYADLSFNKEEYPAEVPSPCLLLTAGVDVQDDRLECEVVGWGLDMESWSIDYKVFYGDPAQKDLWQDLKDYLTREFFDEERRPLKIKAAAIDSGGHHTDEVYNFCKANAGRRFFAIKGSSVAGLPIAPTKPSIKGKVRCKLFMIGTDSAKDRIFASLKTPEPGPNYCHFPAERSDEFFKMLCAEKKITKFVAGRAKTQYVKVTASARNEALDCRVYALAAVSIINPDWRSFARKRRNSAELRGKTREKGENLPEKSENAPYQTEKQQNARMTKKRRKKKSFVPKPKGGGFIKNY